jgi:hypothetical protein
MAGLVPAIHRGTVLAGMARTSLAMTAEAASANQPRANLSVGWYQSAIGRDNVLRP